MKKYEITFIVGENYTEDKAKEIAKNVRESIEKKNGRVEVDLFWGKRKLTYKIMKNTFGYYFVFVFFADSKIIAEMTKELNLNEKVIRYLMVDFVEKTPFFEEVNERKNKAAQGIKDDRSENSELPERKVRKEVPKISEEPKEIKEEIKVESAPEKVEEKKVEKKEEIIKKTEEKTTKKDEESKEIIETIEDKKEEKTEKVEIEEAKEEPKEEAKEEKITEKVEEKKEEKIERKPERKKMTDDERKEQLEKRLAELLKEEEE